MSKKLTRTGNISKQDIKTWTEYLMTGDVHDDKHRKELLRLSQRSINLADVATIVDFMSRRNDGYIQGLIEQNAVQEKVLHKLGATADIFSEAKAEYEEELAEIQKQIEEAQKQLQQQVENATKGA